MITFLLLFATVLGVLPTPWFVFALTGLVDGLVLIPLVTVGFVQFGPAGLRTKIGRLHFLQGTVIGDGTITVLGPDGYRHCAFDEDEGVIFHPKAIDGYFEWDWDDTTWYRLGKRKYAVTYLPCEETVGRFRDEDAELVEMDEDGDVGILNRIRNGDWAFTDYPEHVRDGGDGYLVSISKAANALRGGAGTKVSDRTEKHTMKREGGKGEFSSKMQLITAVVMILSGAGTGILIFGVL